MRFNGQTKNCMRTCIFAICVMQTLSAFAQSQSISFNYQPSLSYFGKTQQSFHDNYFASRKGDATLNSAFNILYSIRISPKLKISTGLEYAQQGQNINFNADSAWPSSNHQVLKIQLDYVRIPLMISYTILRTKKSELDIYSGASLGFAIEKNDNYQEIILEAILLPPSSKRYKDMDWAVPVGLNFKRQLNSRLFVNLGCEYLAGLTNSFSDRSFSSFGVLSQFSHSRQSRLGLRVGMGFDL
jgi:hypothetical protein